MRMSNKNKSSNFKAWVSQQIDLQQPCYRKPMYLWQQNTIYPTGPVLQQQFHEASDLFTIYKRGKVFKF